MKNVLALTFVILQILIHTYAMDAYAVNETQSVYFLGGPSESIFYSDGSFINGIVGYEKDFTQKWSISAEIQLSFRTEPESGKLYSLTPVFRYKFFDIGIIDPYALVGVGAMHHDTGSIHQGDENGHRTDSDFMYHVVAGFGIEKKFEWLSLVTEIRYEHESDMSKHDNYGCDKINGFFGIKINF